MAAVVTVQRAVGYTWRKASAAAAALAQHLARPPMAAVITNLAGSGRDMQRKPMVPMVDTKVICGMWNVVQKNMGKPCA